MPREQRVEAHLRPVVQVSGRVSEVAQIGAAGDIEDGHAELDYAATLLLLEKWAGVEVKGQAA